MKYIIFISVVLMSACTNKHSAGDHLIGKGYTLIEYKGYNYNISSCRRPYPFRTQFKVIDLKNKIRTVTVCQGVGTYIYNN